MLDFDSMLYRIPALLIAVTIHEYAHAQTADAMGDPTPRFLGRLTFNPLAHLDVLGALMLVFAGFGWAKPVAINPNNFRNRKEGMIKVSLAGPGANLFLCFLAALLLAIMEKMGLATRGVYSFLAWAQLYNVWFAFFNLIPIPPLDGSRLLCEFLSPASAYKYKEVVGRYSFFILIGLVMSGLIGVIIRPLASLYMALVSGVLRIFF